MLDPERRRLIELKEKYMASEQKKFFVLTHKCGIKHYTDSKNTDSITCECQADHPEHTLIVCELGHGFLWPKAELLFDPDGSKCPTCMTIFNTKMSYEDEDAKQARQKFKEDWNLVPVPGFERLSPEQVERKLKNMELVQQLKEVMKELKHEF